MTKDWSDLLPEIVKSIASRIFVIKAVMTKDWSDLLPEIVNSIAREISVYEDWLVFMDVCSSWRLAVTEDKTFVPPLVSRYPSLMLAESKAEEEKDYRQIFLLSGGGGVTGKLHLPELRNQRIVSSRGWLLTAAEDEIQAKLINPYSAVQIDLPDLSTLPYYSIRSIFHNNTMCKVLLTSSDPFSDPMFRIVVIYARKRMLGFCKPGDDSWTHIDKGWKEGARISDVIYHNARKRIYVVTRFGSIYEGDLYGPNPTSLLELSKYPEYLDYCGYVGLYVIEWDYDTLLVVRHDFEEGFDTEDEEDMYDGDRFKYPKSPIPYHTIGFQVYQFSLKDNTMTEVDDLGDRAIFLGCNSSFYIRVSGDDGCFVKANCIYFTDDCCELYADVPEDGGKSIWGDVPVGGGRDMGIYHMDDGTIEPLSNQLEESLSLVSPPLWLASSVC